MNMIDRCGGSVMIGADEYQRLVQAARDYQILTRTMLRTAYIMYDHDQLRINDDAVVEVMKSLGLNVEGTLENLREEMARDKKEESHEW
jgi:hypothetical protein